MELEKLRESKTFLIITLFFLAGVTYFPLLTNPHLYGDEYGMFLVHFFSLIFLAIILFSFAAHSRQSLSVAALFSSLVVVNPLALPILLSDYGVFILGPLFIISVCLFLFAQMSIKLLGVTLSLVVPVLILGGASLQWGIDMGITLLSLGGLYYISIKVFSLKRRQSLALSFILILLSMGMTQYRGLSLGDYNEWVKFKVATRAHIENRELWQHISHMLQFESIPEDALVMVANNIISRNEQERGLVQLVLNSQKVEDQSIDEQERKELLDKNLAIAQSIHPFDKLNERQVRVLALVSNRIIISSIALPSTQFLNYFGDYYQIIAPLLERDDFESLRDHRESIRGLEDVFN